MSAAQNIIGPVVRALREKRGITQAQMVAKLNLLGWDLSRATFSKIEAQIRCVADYEIPLLATCLGIPPGELITAAVSNAQKQPKFSPPALKKFRS
jgi:transcriptional regulator with XRE-family HTH domain